MWWDGELTGGTQWWASILAQIRGCDVFLLAMSRASLQSPACRLELGYATQVWKLVLPLQLDAVPDYLLQSVVASVHFVDYRRSRPNRTDHLLWALHTLPPARPLPAPLPADPPAPGAHITELAELIHQTSPLGVQQQYQALLQLRVALAHPNERKSARALLERLRARPETAHGLVAEITLTLEMMPGWTGRPKRRQLTWLYVGTIFTSGLLGVVLGLVYFRNPAWRPHAAIMLVLGAAWCVYTMGKATGLIVLH